MISFGLDPDYKNSFYSKLGIDHQYQSYIHGLWNFCILLGDFKSMIILLNRLPNEGKDIHLLIHVHSYLTSSTNVLSKEVL